MPLPQSVSRSLFFQALLLITLFGVSVPGAYASHPQLICNPHDVFFGKVVTGHAVIVPVTLSNTGTSTVTVSNVQVSNAAYRISNFVMPQTLTAGQSVNFSVVFMPVTTGTEQGVVSITSNASNSTLNLEVSGKGVNNWALQASPASLAFGNVVIGSSSTQPLTVSNPGPSSQTVSIGNVGGTGYSVSGVTLPLILAAGQSFTFNVTFAPTAVGVVNGSIVATSPTSPALNIPLNGDGIPMAGQLIITPATMNFGNVTVGQTSSQGGQLTAANASVTITSANMSNPVFALSGISLPVTLAVGQSVNYTVTVAPTSSGQLNGSLSFFSNAVNSPTVQILAALAVLAQYSVNLSWNPSTSQVVGYNVYRSNQSGGPYSRLNSDLDPNTIYTDSSVDPGETYYYATTAVNSEGQESAYSNLTQAVIP